MPYGAVRAGDFKLIEFYDDNRVELYNLREDLGETRDLAASLPEKAAELRQRLHAWRQRPIRPSIRCVRSTSRRRSSVGVTFRPKRRLE
jgi:hypothetical protein